eukprot:11049089-Ditylum_brightwellii.AAC.1
MEHKWSCTNWSLLVGMGLSVGILSMGSPLQKSVVVGLAYQRFKSSIRVSMEASCKRKMERSPDLS